MELDYTMPRVSHSTRKSTPQEGMSDEERSYLDEVREAARKKYQQSADILTGYFKWSFVGLLICKGLYPTLGWHVVLSPLYMWAGLLGVLLVMIGVMRVAAMIFTRLGNWIASSSKEKAC